MSFDKDERKKYLMDWKKENQAYLHAALCVADGPELRFLNGILFAPSFTKDTVCHLQDVIQADGAHVSFGKYTLYSAYASTANGNMSPLGFGLLFGNKDIDNWTKFWGFIKSIHPSVNVMNKTIMTNQDKGSIAAVSSVLNLAGQFHCGFHRRQNIIKTCGGASGKITLSTL